VVRNILEPETISVRTEEQIRKVLASPPREWSKSDGVTKAARLGFDFGEEPSETAPGSEPSQEAPPANPFEGVEKELEQFILDNVKKRIKDKLQKKVEEKAISGGPGTGDENGELGTSTGDNIIHQGSVIAWTPMQKRAAQYRTGLATLLRVAGSDIELMEYIARLNTRFGVKVSREIYRVGLRVGSTVNHPSLEGYLTACRQVLGRDPTAGEAKTLVRLGQLLALRS
jgi:hypothetical protein